MMSLELKKSYFSEVLGRPMSQNYNATEVRTNMNLRAIRKALTLVGFKEYPADLDDATVTHFKKEAVHIVVTVLTSHNTALDVEIDPLPSLETSEKRIIDYLNEEGNWIESDLGRRVKNTSMCGGKYLLTDPDGNVESLTDDEQKVIRWLRDENLIVEETGEVVCCFNCAGYDQEDGFCNYHERYKDEQVKCKHFEPNNG